VSSLDTDKRHQVGPIEFSGSVENAKEKLLDILYGMKRAQVVSTGDNLIQAEFTSFLFRFVDDVEFFFDDRMKIIHVKSASRVGYYDFGVNRRRIEDIRKQFDQ